MKKVDKIYKDIKSVKIQGATNIAKAAIEAYSLSPNKRTKKKLLSLRPTEPTLSNSLNRLEKESKVKVLAHFKESQEKINKLIYKLIKNNSVIYTHCHSTNVSNALINSKKRGKKFSVVSTETRPLFQGRKTAKQLSAAKIKVTAFVDAAMHEAIKEADLIFLGADAILKNKVINKIGSQSIAELARLHKKPVYIIADSWKYSPKNVKIEERDFHEVWKTAPKQIKVRNPAFGGIPKEYIKKIISELGTLSYSEFIKKAKKTI